MRRFYLASSLIMVLLGSVGCSSTSDRKGAAPTAKVKGTVTMDGKALRDGELHFSVLGYAPCVLEIKDGKFEGEAPIGKNEVQLLILVDGPLVKGNRLKNNIAPEKYWGPNTTLSANVEANGANDFKFTLTSK